MTAGRRTIELRVLCEGPTERDFVTQVLKPHLRVFGVFARSELLTPRGGGVVPFAQLRKAIQAEVGRSRGHQYVTTMIDLYGLVDFPGSVPRVTDTVATRVARIETSMAESLPNPRFVPYIQVHEFEALVFVDLSELEPAFPDGEAEDAVAKLRQEIGDLPPEEIDDGPQTAPSKRLIRAIPQYENLKRVAGPAITAKIGIERLRGACPHFGGWLSKLERLASEAR